MPHATTNWNKADNSIHRVLAASLRIVANVAAQGIYSRQKIIRQKALSCPKPAVPRIPTSVSIPAAELILGTPNKTAQLDTTTSFAEMPAIKATAICQKPNPTGAKNGTSQCPKMAPKLSVISVV